MEHVFSGFFSVVVVFRETHFSNVESRREEKLVGKKGLCGCIECNGFFKFILNFFDFFFSIFVLIY